MHILELLGWRSDQAVEQQTRPPWIFPTLLAAVVVIVSGGLILLGLVPWLSIAIGGCAAAAVTRLPLNRMRP
ncbi:hypothetical protein [Streptomyces xanthochromogenes]|uniref:hypothetical protein n=1 Tax=Streptomyces xanthochromogenes TaxID=67384 RepID=UPI003425DC70